MLFENLLSCFDRHLSLEKSVNDLSAHLLFAVDIHNFVLVVVGEKDPELCRLLEDFLSETFLERLGLQGGHNSFFRKNLGAFDGIKVENLLPVKKEFELFPPLAGVSILLVLRSEEFLEDNRHLILEFQFGHLLGIEYHFVRRFANNSMSLFLGCG